MCPARKREKKSVVVLCIIHNCIRSFIGSPRALCGFVITFRGRSEAEQARKGIAQPHPAWHTAAHRDSGSGMELDWQEVSRWGWLGKKGRTLPPKDSQGSSAGKCRKPNSVQPAPPLSLMKTRPPLHLGDVWPSRRSNQMHHCPCC